MLTSNFARNDLDLVGVKAGCSLRLWSGLRYSGSSTVITAVFQDRQVLPAATRCRWEVLAEHPQLHAFHEDVESLACSCGPAQRDPNLGSILQD